MEKKEKSTKITKKQNVTKEQKPKKTLARKPKKKSIMKQFEGSSSEEETKEDKELDSPVKDYSKKKDHNYAAVLDKTGITLTKGQKNALFTVTYKNSLEKIVSYDRPDIFYEIIGILKDKENTFDEVIDFLKDQSDPESVVFTQPAMMPYKQILDREISLQQTEKDPVIKNVGKCKYCNSTELSFSVKQIRSGDEGKTTFVRCGICGKDWKEG
jgi:DNA-directed RNA polymerase subunit M/transcription elongation factor TFIIS